MTPEVMILELTDGTQFSAEVHVEAGKLHVRVGNWMGMAFVIEPHSVTAICRRILELMPMENVPDGQGH
jgi:hypothetical protein